MYISDELAHFVGRACGNTDAQYQLLVKIIQSGCLSNSEENARRTDSYAELKCNYGAKISNNEMYLPQMVCFCDIPFQDLKIHINKYSPFGLSFKKHFIVKNGGAPVYYIPIHASVSKYINKGDYFDKKIDRFYNYSREELRSRCSDVDDILNEIEDFLDYEVFSFVKFFNHDHDETHEENFYYEREWRILGNLRFCVGDIASVIVPSAYKKQFISDCPECKEKLKCV